MICLVMFEDFLTFLTMFLFFLIVFYKFFICSFFWILRILLCIHRRAGVRQQGLQQDGAHIRILQHCGPVCENGSGSFCDCFAVDVGGDIVAVIQRGMEL